MNVTRDHPTERLWQGWDVATDLVIATALIWTLPLLLGAMAALFKLLDT